MHVDQCTHLRPVIQPLRVERRCVDAAVAHGMAKVVVPVGAVNAIALIKVHHVRHIGQIVTGAAHRLRRILHVDAILSGHRRRARQSRRYGDPIDRCMPFIRDQALIAEIDIDPAFTG